MAEEIPVLERTPLETYRGSCHCGMVVFTLQVPEIKAATQCDCSICTKKGNLWFFPGDGITLTGDVFLVTYKFGSKEASHKFCKLCGTCVLAHNPTLPKVTDMAVNVRNIHGLDIWKLKLNKFNGKQLHPQYRPPASHGLGGPSRGAGWKLYDGGCHCGNVTIRIKVKPLDDSYPHSIVGCSCSQCRRNAYIWIYPKKDQVAIRGGDLSLVYYGSSSSIYRKGFCRSCGVHVAAELNIDVEAGVTTCSSDIQAHRTGKDVQPVNLRMLNNFNLDTVMDQMVHYEELSEPTHIKVDGLLNAGDRRPYNNGRADRGPYGDGYAHMGEDDYHYDDDMGDDDVDDDMVDPDQDDGYYDAFMASRAELGRYPDNEGFVDRVMERIPRQETGMAPQTVTYEWKYTNTGYSMTTKVMTEKVARTMSDAQLKAAFEWNELNNMTVLDLKGVLASKGLSRTGRKAELVSRLEHWISRRL